jgi:putative sigma-54 modulation protein
MKIDIQTPGFDGQQALLDYTEQKVNKLGHFSERIMEARVCLKVDRSDTRSNKVCEIILAIPGNDLFASKQSESFEDAISKTVHALKEQVVAWKEKVNNE